MQSFLFLQNYFIKYLPSCYSQSYENIFFLTTVILDFASFCSSFILLALHPECLALLSVSLFAFSLNQLHFSHAFPILRLAFQPLSVSPGVNFHRGAATLFILTSSEMVVIQLQRCSNTCDHPHIFPGRTKYFLIILLENGKALLNWACSWDKGTNQSSLCSISCGILRAEMPVQDQPGILLLLEFAREPIHPSWSAPSPSQPGQFNVTHAVASRFSLKKLAVYQL